MTGWTEQTRHSPASKSKASLRTESVTLCALCSVHCIYSTAMLGYTVAQNRGSWGHFRFWPYSSFLWLSKGSVRLGWATQWLRIGVHEDSHFERRSTDLPLLPAAASVDRVLLYNHHNHLYDEFDKRHKRRQQLLQVNVTLAFCCGNWAAHQEKGNQCYSVNKYIIQSGDCN